MKALLLFLMFLIMLCGTLSADINQYYTFQSRIQTYIPINGTVVDTINNPVDIGFPFHYGENIYTQLRISYYGYVYFNLALNHLSSNNLNFNVYHPILAPLWDNWRFTTQCMYVLSGSAPNRVFTVQFTDMNWCIYPYLTSAYDFQVKLYESGQIDFCYGPGGGDDSSGRGASIGINMEPGGVGNYLSVRLLPTLTVSSTDNYNSNSTYPGENTIFSFLPAQLPAHDLIGESINCPPSLVQNEAGTLTVTVNNHGTAPDDNYTINLMEGTNVLATTTGPPIAANDGYATASLSWTPATIGTHLLRAEVIGLNDEVPGNNVTDSISVAVFPASTTPVTLADSTQLTVEPSIVFEYSSLGEILYRASAINHLGTINAISYYNHFWGNVFDVPTRIWMGTTVLDSLPVTWIPSTQLTQVFDGTVNYLAGEHVICIPLDTPFTYSGQNLVVMVYKPGSDTGHSPNNLFFGLTSADYNSSLLAGRSTDDINPASPPALDHAYQSMPKTTFHFIDGVSNPTEVPAISSELLNNYPNPFHRETSIAYDVKENQPVTINIYNLKGQLVKTLVNEMKAAGHYNATWNGKDKHDKNVSPGIYLYQMQGKNINITRKMLLMK